MSHGSDTRSFRETLGDGRRGWSASVTNRDISRSFEKFKGIKCGCLLEAVDGLLLLPSFERNRVCGQGSNASLCSNE
jgi:hypothetical protein